MAAPGSPSVPSLELKVAEALAKDLGRGYARIDPADMKRLGVETGDIVEVAGKRKTVCKVMPAYADHRGQAKVQIDGLARENAGTHLGEAVAVGKAAALPAQRLVLDPLTLQPRDRDLKYIGSLLNGLPVREGDRLRVALFGRRSADFRVASSTPPGPVLVHPATVLQLAKAKEPREAAPRLSYEDIGGLKRELQRIREIIELPLRYPEVFERLGIDAPKGVLLQGPPGCGKTLIARAVAHETDAAFFTVNGPEIIHKFYGESEAHLRKIFDEASKRAPSIVFIDEIDAIAPRREKVVGDVEKRVVAQLLALMDGLASRKHVIVIAATNIPNALDPALRRPGRFDREIAISIPDRDGRLEILEVHSRGMPLAEDVDMGRIASITHGYVGADLAALCREAAMICVRRLLPEIDFAAAHIPYDSLAQLHVHMDDFVQALHEVEPSAVREVFVEVPEVHWSDIGGLEAVKQKLVESVEWPLRYPELYAKMGVRPPRGILLSGPPGCGKTLLAKAVANETQVNFISIKGPELLSKWVGESESGVREVFRKAKQAAPCVLFFDELDALVPERGGGGGDAHVTERVIGQFLAEMDGVEELGGVLVLAATNRRDILDPALLRPGRFDLQIEIPSPDQAGRRAILQIALRNKPVDPSVDADRLAAATEGMTGADLQAICTRAALDALRETLEQHGGKALSAMTAVVRDEHLDRAAQALREQSQPQH